MADKKLPNGLTVRQDDFAQYIAEGRGQGQAAKDAGYAAHTADSQACRLLKNVKIQARVAEYAKRRADKVDLTAAFVLNGLMFNAAAGQAAGDLSASNSAYGLLGKHLRLFIDRTSVELGDSTREFLNDVVTVLDEEIVEPSLRGRIIARLVALAGPKDYIGLGGR